jgi:hypothetical protein
MLLFSGPDTIECEGQTRLIGFARVLSGIKSLDTGRVIVAHQQPAMIGGWIVRLDSFNFKMLLAHRSWRAKLVRAWLIRALGRYAHFSLPPTPPPSPL